MADLIAAAKQALEALENAEDQLAKPYSTDASNAITALSAALAQQVEPVEPVAWLVKWANAYDGEAYTEWQKGYDAARSVVKAHLPVSHTQSHEPQQAEPVEPVAWMVYTEGGASAYVTDNPNDLIGAYRALPLYTAPPQRKPLTVTKLLPRKLPEENDE